MEQLPTVFISHVLRHSLAERRYCNIPDAETDIRRGSGVLNLMLKRNYEIDPNADIYLVERAKDDRSILSKTTLEREVSFY
ncbi:hypothetical protein CHS0354_019814 [Potamilus streckersoni]|uniref:Uncharacterized protein n=1 Tax=Potamilus streckersoni TaxID=2493646 RepID=A0AAE0W174_9BIVA|nr:hypothetical protein CHS0354_019814 [Potamilus streckersoni]